MIVCMKTFLLFCTMISLANISALDTSCLTRQSAPITPTIGETFRITSTDDIYPVQDGIIIPIR